MTAADLAWAYGFTDVDGTRPDAWAAIEAADGARRRVGCAAMQAGDQVPDFELPDQTGGTPAR